VTWSITSRVTCCVTCSGYACRDGWHHGVTWWITCPSSVWHVRYCVKPREDRIKLKYFSSIKVNFWRLTPKLQTFSKRFYILQTWGPISFRPNQYPEGVIGPILVNRFLAWKINLINGPH
jgi:hypothetical protein